MDITIYKAINGWIIRRSFINIGRCEEYIFRTLKELGDWIVENAPQDNPKDSVLPKEEK